MKVDCERCGMQIDKRGLASHQNGTDCRLAANVLEMQQRGWRRCEQYRQEVKSAGAPHEYVEDRVTQRGFIGRRTKTGQSLWVPLWVFGIVTSALPQVQRQELLREGVGGDEAAKITGLILLARGGV